MWKQLTRLTSADFNSPGDDPTIDDCVLDPNDPAQELINPGKLKAVEPRTDLEQWTKVPQAPNKAQIMRDNNIKPGTEEWFKLFFGDKR